MKTETRNPKPERIPNSEIRSTEKRAIPSMDDFVYRDDAQRLHRVKRIRLLGFMTMDWLPARKEWDWENAQGISPFHASTIWTYEPHRVLSLGEIEEAGLLGGVELLGA